jgi:hypothetical protein
VHYGFLNPSKILALFFESIKPWITVRNIPAGPGTIKKREMRSTIPTTEEEFLKRAIRFCESVDDYAELLELDAVKVMAFKSNKLLIDFAYHNREQFDELHKNSFENGMMNLETSFADLIEQCKASPNYKISIGKELGIEGHLN